MFGTILLMVTTVREVTAFHKHDTDSKIVGGYKVSDNESIPFIVSIQEENYGHFCGGSIFSPVYVLSACHCFVDPGSTDFRHPLDSILFVAGLIHLSDKTHAQERKAKELFVHPLCSADPWDVAVYDFSVSRVKRPFEVNAFVQPFKILSTDPQIFSGEMEELIEDTESVCQVAGWGETRRGVEEPVASDVLNAVRMYIIPEKRCQKLYGSRIPKMAVFPFSTYNQICTISSNGDESDCQGDSGGPFFCGEYVIGVISYGLECGTSIPNVYTTLPDFLEWFTSEISKSNSSKHSGKVKNHHSKKGSSGKTEKTIDTPAARKLNRDGISKPNVTLIVLMMWSQLCYKTVFLKYIFFNKDELY